MEGFSVQKHVPPVLKERPGERLTARQIAEIVFERHPAECQVKKLRSRAKVNPIVTDNQLVGQIATEVNTDRKVLSERHYIKFTEDRPRLFFYSTSTDDADVEAAETAVPPREIIALGESQALTTSPSYTEADLYPLLSQYLLSELGVYSKRINEKRSANGRGPSGNKWLYPDLVGLEDLTAGWSRDVIDCVKAYSGARGKLYSFEVKKLLNGSNVREAYFQAVSNSAWANFSYLVAAQMEGEALSELRVLAGMHGVGVIRLDPQDPTGKSEIRIPARERPMVDWNGVNRLASESRDFCEFLQHVQYFQETTKIKSQDWDYGGEVD